MHTVKPVLSSHSKRKPKLGFQDYAQREHSAILTTCIKLPFVFKTYVLSIFELLFKTGFTVVVLNLGQWNRMTFFNRAKQFVH